MTVFGLIGHPISHSKSPQIYEKIFFSETIHGLDYRLFDLADLAELPELLISNPAIQGFNVTLPYKTEIIDYLDILSPESKSINAVNTVLVKRNHPPIESISRIQIPNNGRKQNPFKLLSNKNISLHGYNTDSIGFDQTLTSLIESTQITPKHCIILGNGGSANAVKWVMRKKKISCTVFARTTKNGDIHIRNMTELAAHPLPPKTLVVQTTPLGMYPNEMECIPFPFHNFIRCHIGIDLIYNPKETQFMKQFHHAGGFIVGGNQMLEGQALASWKLFKTQLLA